MSIYWWGNESRYLAEAFVGRNGMLFTLRENVMTRKDQRADKAVTTASAEKGANSLGWKAHVQKVITENVLTRVNGRTASHRTMEHNATVIFAAFKTLHGPLNHPVKNPYNLSDKHVALLVRYWYEEGKAAATMRNDLSVLRKFGNWIGKPGLVRKLPEYLPHASPERLRVAVAPEGNRSKSWSANGIDVEKKLARAFEIDERFGLMVALQLAFGMRRKEVLAFQVWVSDQRERGSNVLKLYRGTKGGRLRDPEIEFKFQEAVLVMAKQRLNKRENLGWPKDAYGRPTNLKTNIERYKYFMKLLGIGKANCHVVAHGLRAEYAENCALLEGFVPATLGGSADQMSPEDLEVRKRRVSERLGHHRPQVTASYFGKFKSRAKPKAGDVDGKAPAGSEPVERRAEPTTCEERPSHRKSGANSTIIEPPAGVDASRAPVRLKAADVFSHYYKSAPAKRERPAALPDQEKAAPPAVTEDLKQSASARNATNK